MRRCYYFFFIQINIRERVDSPWTKGSQANTSILRKKTHTFGSHKLITTHSFHSILNFLCRNFRLVNKIVHFLTKKNCFCFSPIRNFIIFELISMEFCMSLAKSPKKQQLIIFRISRIFLSSPSLDISIECIQSTESWK